MPRKLDELQKRYNSSSHTTKHIGPRHGGPGMRGRHQGGKPKKTKETIETLTDEQVFELLKQKWVDTTISNQNLIFSEIISEFTSKVTYLVNKYKVTFEDVENQLSESSNAICSLLTELNGNEYDEKGISELNKLLRGE